MVFSDGRPEDVGSNDYQEHELRANQYHGAVVTSTQENPCCPLVNTDSGSVTCSGQADEGHSCGLNAFSLADRTDGDDRVSGRYNVAEMESNLNYENTLCHAASHQTSVTTSLGSTASVTRAPSSTSMSSSVVNSSTFPPRLNAEPSGTRSGMSNSGNPIRNNVETCQSSALGRAGNTGSIDVVSRSGLACQIRSNSVQNSTLLGRLSVDERPTVEQPTQTSSISTSEEPIRNSDSPRDSSEQLSRESGALRWVQALEFQGTGACRADERLRPLLRWNVSCVGADGRLLVQLGQHFKVKELNLLARCLCAPLVHIRVGKVLRQGCCLLPTTSRGFLSLTMVPGSVMRLSFIPDGGFVEMLATVSSGSEAPSVSLEVVLADVSGRTFLLKLPDGKLLYFWQSEKLKSTGDELVSKMKDLLSRKPTLSQLTGIEESRLDSFASYICSALNASSATDASQSPASATSAENIHSCAASSSTTSATRTSSHASTSFRGETQRVSLPTARTRSTPEFEDDAYFRPDGLSQGLSQRGVSLVNTPGFPVPDRRSSASLPDGSESRYLTLRRRGASSVGPSPSFSGSSECSLSSTHDTPVSLASSWSIRTSLSESSPEKQETPSLSAGLYTSLNTDSSGPGHDRFQKQYRTSLLASHSLADFSLRGSLPSFLGESASPICSSSPPVSSHLPISPASLLAPYYCPCSLGTFTPPCVPSTTEGGLISPSIPFFSVRPPPSLFPPGSLSFHEFSLSPVQLPVSTLVTAAIPIHSSGISPFCTQPVSSVPILHKPAPYMVRTASPVSGYSSTSSEGLEKSFYSCSSARQATHAESCSVNLSTSSCPGVSAWQSPNNQEAFMPVFDAFLSFSAATSCIKSSTESATQTQSPVLDRNLAGTPGLLGSFESGLRTPTHAIFTSRALSQVTPFDLSPDYASRLAEENKEAPTRTIVDQVSSVSSDMKLKQRNFLADMVATTRCVAGQPFHSTESCSTNGGFRTGESSPSFRSESAEDLSHATVKDTAANRSQHTDGTLKMEEEKNH